MTDVHEVHTRNIGKAQNYNSWKFGLKYNWRYGVWLFPAKQRHLLILHVCTCLGFGDLGFGEMEGHQLFWLLAVFSFAGSQSNFLFILCGKYWLIFCKKLNCAKTFCRCCKFYVSSKSELIKLLFSRLFDTKMHCDNLRRQNKNDNDNIDVFTQLQLQLQL